MKTNIVKLTPNAEYGATLTVVKEPISEVDKGVAEFFIDLIHPELSAYAIDQSLVWCGDRKILSFSVDGLDGLDVHVFKISFKENADGD